MDEQNTTIEDLIAKYESADAEHHAEKQQEQEPPIEKQDGFESAQKLSAFTVRGIEFFFKRIDNRIGYQKDVITEGVEALSPVYQKYNFGSSFDRVPMKEEAAAGWFLGKLFKSTWLVIKSLRESDVRKRKQKQDGDQREFATEQQSHAVSGEERPRQESVPNAPVSHPSQFSEGDSLGHE